MNRNEAINILRTYIHNESLFHHMLSVESVMRFYANKFGESEELWGIVGLLHDFDYEIHPDLNHHPQNGAEILREHRVPEEIILSILSHADHTGIPRDTILRKTLYASDEITGLITACVLVRPSRSIHDLKMSSVKKKWKDKRFAAGANREEMLRGAEDLGIDIWDHVSNVITAMRDIAADISLDGPLQGKSN